MSYLFVGEVARRLNARPKDITDAFYRGLLSASICPLIGNRRCIPPEYVDHIAAVLRRKQRQASS